MPELPNTAPTNACEPVRQRTLLIVDDEENILSSLRRLLRGGGYRVLTALSGRAALEMLDTEPVDVILSDQRMPHMTGVEFLRIAKVRHPDTIRLVLSGYTDIDSITKAINEGAIYKFLTKPWDDDNLRANIEEAFGRKDIIDENHRLHAAIHQANVELETANDCLRQLLAEKQKRIHLDEASLEVAQEVFQHLPWAVLGIDQHGLVSVANAAGLKLFAGNRPFIGCFIRDILPSSWYALLASAPAGDELVREDEIDYRLSWRSMGASSRSEGKLLVICRCATEICPNCRPKNGKDRKHVVGA